VGENGSIVLSAAAFPDLDLGGGPLGAYFSFVGVLEGSSTTGTPLATLRTLGEVTNYPNPFNPRTTIAFDLQRDAVISCTIVDTRGRRVMQRELGSLGAGAHRVTWDGRDLQGRAVASGVYQVVLRSLSELALHRIVLVE
jgi:hypothetical protein